jgi:hypothetical protein
MPPELSTLGVFHTFATVIAIYLAIDCYVSDGRINLKSRNGKAYLILNIFGCISTIWLIARTGTYGPGHAVALLAFILLVLGSILEMKIKRFKLLQALVLTTSVLLSLIPAVMETLTRLPVNAPFATGPEDTVVRASLGIIFLAYLMTCYWQIKSLRNSH